jgi:hypothetical protein
MDCDAYRDRMLDVLYGEASEPDRRAVEAHQAACAECRQELNAFRRLRRDLAGWTVPAAVGPRRTRAVAPWLAVAASAVLAVGAAVGLARAEVRRDQAGWSVRLGPTAAALQARLDEQEQRHRREMGELRARLEQARPEGGAARLVPAEVRALLEQSERRQQERLLQALAELNERSDAQRRYDLAQVSAGFSYLDGKASLHAARTTELVGQVLQASQDQEK